MVIDLKKKQAKMIEWLLSATDHESANPVTWFVNKRGGTLEATNGYVYHGWTPAEMTGELAELTDGMYNMGFDEGLIDNRLIVEPANCHDTFPDPDEKFASSMVGIDNRLTEFAMVGFLVNPGFLQRALKGFNSPTNITVTGKTLIVHGESRYGLGKCRAMIQMMHGDKGPKAKLDTFRPGELVDLL